MPIATINLRPGIDVELTPIANATGWAASNLIRWKEGKAQKRGGWTRMINTPVVGIPRGFHAWADLSGNPYAGIGTEQRLEIFDGTALHDITPLRRVDLTATFTTTNLSATVKITDNSNAAVVGDWIWIPTTVAVGGLSLQGMYSVAAIVDGNNFDITAAATATSGTTNTGEVDYLIHNGLASAGQILETESGQPIDTESGEYIVVGQGGGYLRQWLLDNWGQDLVGNYTGGPLYVWIPPFVAGNVAQSIGGTSYTPGSASNTAITAPNAPTMVNESFVAMPQQILVALGTDVQGNGSQDPNLISWCDVANYTVWTASASNQAGSFRLPSGSRIVGGIQGPQFGYIWTDVDFWMMTYLGPPFVFGFQKVAHGCELLAARSAVIYEGSVYWVSNYQFFMYDGSSLHVLPCPVRDIFFNNLNYAQKDKIWGAPDRFWTEVLWFYPSATGTGEVDSYVSYNTTENIWDYGSLPRTAGQCASVFTQPIYMGANGLIYQHEVSNDADGQVMGEFVQSGWFALSEGAIFQMIERMIPDFVLTGGAAPNNRVKITIDTLNYPTDTIVTYGPFYWSPTNGPPYDIVRARGRLARITIGNSDLGVFWRQGAVRLLEQPAGRR